MRLLLALSILFKASICSREEQGRGGTACICQAVPSVPPGYKELYQPLHARAYPGEGCLCTGTNHPPRSKMVPRQTSGAIKKEQEQKAALVSLIAIPWAGIRRHENTQLLQEHLPQPLQQRCFQTNSLGALITQSIAICRPEQVSQLLFLIQISPYSILLKNFCSPWHGQMDSLLG